MCTKQAPSPKERHVHPKGRSVGEAPTFTEAGPEEAEAWRVSSPSEKDEKKYTSSLGLDRA